MVLWNFDLLWKNYGTMEEAKILWNKNYGTTCTSILKTTKL